ncbi:coproporphyrinogen III oxidase [Clostridium sporogenes]|uniref:Coproporphyrinogen III oxidase n=1 Tax=Clostridium botulinum TaxID=1491 RepID=A0A6M0T1P8_CLOBO|nr:coproporphyrinogen III oxidase [Clostridium sporogenes]NFA60870.1 coproporphyrinogen III oxidase [Clostridium botulinum]NFI75348.1 coproporphyrinogen III oxidase [Clostridium sporogenes]NFL72454.1 coproporphyrinogen III oxidase [Clostridium sporogenes]NFM25006.1 coproporphyrinogen III oxidase [Clostridium sporogenes]NFP63366.1 coproporphyrinogen III oxidase [Clostridium sporogenes]
MKLRVNLNDMKYRYDVYQILNIYYNFYDITFVDKDYDMKIEITDEGMRIKKEDEIIKYDKDSSLVKKEWVKKFLFLYLKLITNKNLPWGTLVGIRPSKIALDLMNKGMGEKEIIDWFSKHRNTRADKAKLCIDIANMEKSIVNKDQNTVSVYVGMPFCPTRCLYCSFTSNPIGKCKNLVEPYLKALYYEMDMLSEYIQYKGLKIQCVYFGGGTPTSINNDQFENTLNKIYYNFVHNKNVEEFTVECGRPDSITEEKLLSMKKYDVDRISINPQTMNNMTLKNIGRTHSVKDIERIYYLAKNIGFKNINMDLIVGLPGEGIEEIKNTCKEIKKLNPDNITVHGMSIKRGSILHEKLVNKMEFNIPKQEELNKMYEETEKLAKDLGINPYYMYRQKNMLGNMENVGYSKKDKIGIYNIQMIEERQTIIALGADAVSKIIFMDENRIERAANVKDVIEYTKRVEEMVQRKKRILDTLYL